MDEFSNSQDIRSIMSLVDRLAALPALLLLLDNVLGCLVCIRWVTPQHFAGSLYRARTSIAVASTAHSGTQIQSAYCWPSNSDIRIFQEICYGVGQLLR